MRILEKTRRTTWPSRSCMARIRSMTRRGVAEFPVADARIRLGQANLPEFDWAQRAQCMTGITLCTRSMFIPQSHLVTHTTTGSMWSLGVTRACTKFQKVGPTRQPMACPSRPIDLAGRSDCIHSTVCILVPHWWDSHAGE